MAIDHNGNYIAYVPLWQARDFDVNRDYDRYRKELECKPMFKLTDLITGNSFEKPMETGTAPAVFLKKGDVIQTSMGASGQVLGVPENSHDSAFVWMDPRAV